MGKAKQIEKLNPQPTGETVFFTVQNNAGYLYSIRAFFIPYLAQLDDKNAKQ